MPPSAIPSDWGAIALDLTQHFWGEPNKALSNQKELRWGNQGTKTLNINEGVWYDHEARYGGVIKLVEIELKIDEQEAGKWLFRVKILLDKVWKNPYISCFSGYKTSPQPLTERHCL